jgi:ankyrin repeat protein
VRAQGGIVGVACALALWAADADAQIIQIPADWYNIATAAAGNKTEEVRVLLAKGSNPNTSDLQGRTPLSYAAQLGNLEMAAMLINAGASPDARDKLGNSAVHWAAEAGQVQLLRLFCDVHAGVDVANRQGITPLMMASGRGHLAVVRLLLQQGANPRKQDYTGRDALGWAAGQAPVMRALQDATRS